jgi:hypothetical protein
MAADGVRMGKALCDTGQAGEYHAVWYQAVVHARGLHPNLEIPKGCITCYHNGNRTTCY